MANSKSALLHTIFTGVMALLAIAILPGCGGGTSGTGDVGFTKINGTVVQSDGMPLQDATVIVADSGSSGTTDKAGRFTISTTLREDNPVLIVQGTGVDASVTLQGVSKSVTGIEVALSVSGNGAQLQIVSLNVSVEEIPTATPTPPSTPTSKPTPTITPSVPSENSKNEWRFAGTVKLKNGAPVPAANLRITPGGVQTRTAGDGAFSASTTGKGSVATIELTYKNQTASVSVKNLPQNSDLKITLELVVSFDSSSIDPNNPDPGAEVLSVQLGSVAVQSGV